MKKKLPGLTGALIEIERREAITRAEGYPICIGCGWPSDDPELELCCDCADDIFMRQMLRGDFGKTEQREARESNAR